MRIVVRRRGHGARERDGINGASEIRVGQGFSRADAFARVELQEKLQQVDRCSGSETSQHIGRKHRFLYLAVMLSATLAGMGF